MHYLSRILEKDRIDPKEEKFVDALKRGSHNDVKSWLNYWSIREVIMEIKNIVKDNIKKNLWGDTELENKRKSRYYREFRVTSYIA
jgi:hypothetical protein